MPSAHLPKTNHDRLGRDRCCLHDRDGSKIRESQRLVVGSNDAVTNIGNRAPRNRPRIPLHRLFGTSHSDQTCCFAFYSPRTLTVSSCHPSTHNTPYLCLVHASLHASRLWPSRHRAPLSLTWLFADVLRLKPLRACVCTSAYLISVCAVLPCHLRISICAVVKTPGRTR